MKQHKTILWLILSCLIFVFGQNISAQNKSNKKDNHIKLNILLMKTGQYCKKLGSTVFDYVCHEEISEKIYHSLHVETDYSLKSPKVYERTVKNNYLNEYQLMRKNGKIEENRTLLERNGKKINRKDAGLGTFEFYYGYMIFGPIGLLSRQNQRYYDYRILKEEVSNGENIIVIEANPIPSNKEYLPFGKIWVRESDFAIMKIEWHQKSIRNSQIIEERAKKYKAEPFITLTSEFNVEKKGVRFPSRVVFEEAYVKRSGRKIMYSELTVVYKDYKFFTVEVEVDYK